MKVQFLGLGYIGLPTAAIVAQKEIKVHGVDVNQKVVDTINRGEIHIIEPGLAAVVKEGVEKGFFEASVNASIADVHLIVVPTPFKGHQEPDISFVESATRAVLPHLKAGDTFIIESTSPVGTTEQMAKLIFSERPELEGKIFIAYCPERVLPGNVLHELIHNDRVIGGIDEASTEKAKAFYQTFVQGKLHSTNARTAEMCKLTE
ncbi:MAG: nucleotide sugar dehydrogenase, partial [Prolixibacteraceae bacterium]|nr:nucleotide sugar dehydrogenase [Prolixibacteraceae bacterium]